jgi:outer membrane autotransporter protein
MAGHLQCALSCTTKAALGFGQLSDMFHVCGRYKHLHLAGLSEGISMTHAPASLRPRNLSSGPSRRTTPFCPISIALAAVAARAELRCSFETLRQRRGPPECNKTLARCAAMAEADHSPAQGRTVTGGATFAVWVAALIIPLYAIIAAQPAAAQTVETSPISVPPNLAGPVQPEIDITVPGAGFAQGVFAGTGGAVTLQGGSVTITGGEGVVPVFASGGMITGNNVNVSVNSRFSPALQADGLNSAGGVSPGVGEIIWSGGIITKTGDTAAGAIVARNGGTVAVSGTTMNVSQGVELSNGGVVTLNEVTMTGALFGVFAENAFGPAANTFTMNGGSLSAATPFNSGVSSVVSLGPTPVTFNVNGATVTSTSGTLVSVQNDSKVTINATNSTLTGNILIDDATDSTLNLTLNNTTLTGDVDDTGGTIINADINLANATDLWNVTGNTIIIGTLTNGGTINFPAPTGNPTLQSSYVTLTTTNYTVPPGAGGTIGLHTFLGADNSPSNQLIINGGTATGNTSLQVTNVGGPGAQTTQNGILLVNAINGATTDPFTLGNSELRAGSYDYRLFRGGLSGSDPNDYFLRSTFDVPPMPPPPPSPPLEEDVPGSTFPDEPPPQPLPPAVYPIIGPELATYGVVQPIARQMGITMLGTLQERIGDTLTLENAGPDAEGWGRSGWVRFFGQQIDNKYESFTDPSVDGRLFGVQAGFDILRASFIPGHRDVAGLYFAYGNSAMDVNGLVTNAAATGYVFTRTGTVNLYGYSGGVYWTHCGPSGWYLDAVVQGTAYSGNATTQFANLSTSGSGIITSLEAGYPIPLSLGPRFILEPQGQILWQHTSFSQANDGLGPVSLGSTSGATGRLGLRAQSTVVTQSGQVWQPYVRANLWQNWGGQATTTFGTEGVPLLQESTQLEFAAGLTFKYSPCLSFYAQAGYMFGIGGDTDGGRRQGAKGDIGLRLTFGAPPPPPPPAPVAVAAPAPAVARSYLVFFDWDKATLTDRARQIIREAANSSAHVQYTRIVVNGYTDTSGTPRYNQGLSMRRAQAVAGELVRDGVPASAISIRGYGQSNLLVPTGLGVREPQNRRVEIIMQ